MIENGLLHGATSHSYHVNVLLPQAANQSDFLFFPLLAQFVICVALKMLS